jgi:hypothetical protein
VLQFTSDINSAAPLKVGGLNGDSSPLAIVNNGIEYLSAVRAQTIGDSIVQFYQQGLIAEDMLLYNVQVDSSCEAQLSIVRAPGFNITTNCANNLAVLGPRYQLDRGGSCSPVSMFAVPMKNPVASATVASSTSTYPAAPTASTCVLPDQFTIWVNQTGYPPQYLSDPNPNDDEALEFTTDFSQSLVFSITNTGQLEFNIVDYYGNEVQMYSEQDPQNPGNEAVFFSTSYNADYHDYLPILASLNPDCTLSLTLPADAASVVQVCQGTLFLTLSPSSSCVDANLIIQPLVWSLVM